MALPFWERIYVVYYREGGMLYLRCKCIQGETRPRVAFLYSPLKPIREWKRRYKFAHKTICVCITNMQLPLVPAPINRIIRGEGRMCFLILVGWKLHARFKSKGREGYQAEGEGRRGRNNELSVWFCGYFTSCLWEAVGSHTIQCGEGTYGAKKNWCYVSRKAGTGKQGEGKIFTVAESISSQPVKSTVWRNEWCCKWRQSALQWQATISVTSNALRPAGQGQRSLRSTQGQGSVQWPVERDADFLARWCVNMQYLQIPLEILCLQFHYSCISHLLFCSWFVTEREVKQTSNVAMYFVSCWWKPDFYESSDVLECSKTLLEYAFYDYQKCHNISSY